MDRGAWQATARGVTESPTRLSDFTFTFAVHMCLFKHESYSKTMQQIEEV